jgi:hypothetical protein
VNNGGLTMCVPPKKKYKLVPCRKCIMLPKCVATFNSCKIEQHMTLSCITTLLNSCSLFDDYTTSYDLMIDKRLAKLRSFDRIKKISQYFDKFSDKDSK